MKWTEEELTRRVGQRICAGFSGTTVTPELRELIKRHKVGNILFFSRNVQSFDQFQGLCAEVRELILAETGLEPFLMIDEECGECSRLGHLTGNTPCASALGGIGDPENARIIGQIIGKKLRAVGVNMDLAPVLDCLSQPRNPVMGSRCFSREPEQVALFGRKFIEGIRESGVLACGKHFPGHGDTAVDSHLALPVINKSLESMEQTELVSFREAIRAGIDAIMSAHIVFPALEPDGVPATISPRVLKGLLREKLGFTGLIISDGMEMKAMLELFPIPEGVFRALKAGVDIALVCHEPPKAAASCLRIMEGVRSGELSPESLEEAYLRIKAKKESLPVTGKAGDFLNPQDQETCAALMRRAVTVVHAPDHQPLPPVTEKTLFCGWPSQRLSLALDGSVLNAAVYAAKYFNSSLCFNGTGDRPADHPDTAVFFFRRGEHLEEDQKEAARLADQGVKVICVAMDTAVVLESAPLNAWHILAWQEQSLAVEAVVSLLKG